MSIHHHDVATHDTQHRKIKVIWLIKCKSHFLDRELTVSYYYLLTWDK